MSLPLTSLSAAGIVRRVKDGELSAVDIAESHLKRIRDRNDRTNAFVTVTDELAREMATARDRTVEDGWPLGPLHGVPVAVKDLYDVEGVRTTRGSLLFEDNVARSDSPMVERLLAAGAVIVGKTNTPEFGWGTTTDNRVVGPTGTPFDPDRVAGGSSGGAGAALADSLVPLAQGSDAGGSIRTPASFCGVFGIKPTYGVVPNAGGPSAFTSHTPFINQGPMARTVEDAALMLDVMAGPHPQDPFSVPADDCYREAIDRSIDDLSIAYSPDLGTYPIDSSVRETLDDAVAIFEDAGATVVRVDPDFGHTQREILDAYLTFTAVLFNTLLDTLEDEGFDPAGTDRSRIGDDLVALVLESDVPSVSDYKRADLVRTHVFTGIQDLLAEHDLLISATLAVLPFPHGEYPESVDKRAVDPHRGWVLTQPYNFSGHPAASIPAGVVKGLPVGMQIAGRRFADDDVLAASATLERIRPWNDAYPE